jgi:hypothetical protein
MDRDTIVARIRNNLEQQLRQVTFEAVEVVMPEALDWRDVLLGGRWNVLYARQFEPPHYRGVRCVIAGGQIGIDQAALSAAQSVGLATGGWCPPKRETLPGHEAIPDWYPLRETWVRDSTNAQGWGEGAGRGGPKPVPRSLRTEWNCRDSDGTLIVPAVLTSDIGTIWTVRFAHEFGKPMYACTIHLPGRKREIEIERVRNWLTANNVEVLNVAGPAILDDHEVKEARRFFRDLFQSITREERP